MSELKPCPFCGSHVMIDKRPAWNGSHGYHGYYFFKIIHESKGCPVTISAEDDDIYRSADEAIKNLVERWNKRVGE